MTSGITALVRVAPLLALGACGAMAQTGTATRTFAASGFDRVDLAGSDDVRIVRGASFSVVATGPQAVLDRLDIHTDGSTLKIARKRDMGWSWGNKGATITVTMPAVRAASVTGSGDMNVDRVDAGDFSGTVTGSGDLEVAAMDAGKVELRVTGSGDIAASGRARASSLEVTGSGDIKADRLVADTAAVSVRGSGDATAGARQSGSVSVAGSGDARVTGTTNCTVSKAGSGEARCG